MKIELTELPFWVSRKVFLKTSGIAPRDLAALVKAGVVRRLVPPNRKDRKCAKGYYYRPDLEALISNELRQP